MHPLPSLEIVSRAKRLNTYIERWPNTTSVWASCRGFDIRVDRYGGVHSLLWCTRTHSFNQFKKHALLKAHARSPCFSYPGPARALISAGSADLSSFGGIGVGWVPDLPCRLLVYYRAKTWPVFSQMVGLTDFLLLFCKNICCSIFYSNSKSVNKTNIGQILTKLLPYP
jgi:hypothetical protein